jgi:hypothetical protein
MAEINEEADMLYMDGKSFLSCSPAQPDTPRGLNSRATPQAVQTAVDECAIIATTVRKDVCLIHEGRGAGELC